MKRLGVLLCALFLASGCASNKGEWDEFWKDVNGDNMKMRSDFSRVTGQREQTPPRTSGD